MHSLFLASPGEHQSEAQALGAWLKENGWDVELAPAETSQYRELEDSVATCCVVLFLLSKASLADEGLRYRLQLVRRMGKRVVCAPIDAAAVEELPAWVRAAGAVVPLPAAIDETGAVSFPPDGLVKLKATLADSRIDPMSFDWPPEQERSRSCYRGLTTLASADAGVFFGRDNALMEALDSLRSLARGRRGGVFVLMGGPGAGKTSFLNAGLLPRLARENESFLLLPTLRPDRGGFHGVQGLVQAIFAIRGGTLSAEQISDALKGGEKTLAPLLAALPKSAEAENAAKLVIVVEQAEALFRDKKQEENARLLSLLKALAEWEDGGVILIYSLKSDALESLQRAASLPKFRTRVFPLPALSRAELQSIVEGPLQRLASPYKLDAELVTALLNDAEASANPLPLLAFALEQLSRQSRADKTLGLADYEKIGRLAGCLDAAADRVLGVTDQGPPPDYDVRLALLRRGLIPWLAGVDAQSGAPRRRLAALREIPVTSVPLIERLEQERLVRRVQDKDSTEVSFELVHDALFEQWKLLKTFIAEEPRLDAIIEGLKRAARNWDRNARSRDSITHSGEELEKAEHLYSQPDALAVLDATDRAYLVACRDKEKLDRTAPAQIPTIEIEPRRAEKSARGSESSGRSARLAWAGMVAALSIAGVAAWKWQASMQEKLAADTRLARSEASIESAIVFSNRLINDLTKKITTANAEQARLVKDVAIQVSEMQERLDDGDAFSKSLRRVQSVGLNTIAQARLASMDAAQALAAAQKSVLLMQTLTSFDANNAGWRRDLSVSYETMGDAQLAVGDIDGALASYRYDLNIAKTLASAAPENAQWRWDMSVSREKLGDAYVAKGDLDKALDAYGDSRTIREALLSANPKNRNYERGLAISYERIGSVLAKRRDVAGATASYEGALEIYQRLARADPKDEQALLSSIVPRWRLAGLNRPRAREHLSPALEILEKLAAEGRLGEDKQQWLTRVRTELAALEQSPNPTP
ncbi:MAG: tetratricopeptide repeat protein [Chloroflexota bacterium]